MVIKYCYFSVSTHSDGHFIYKWFKERRQELHCWFNQDNAVSLHRGIYTIEISSISHFGLAQNSSISITDAQHSSISITDA